MSGASSQQGFPDDCADAIHQDVAHLFRKWQDGQIHDQDVTLLFEKWQDGQDNGQYSVRSSGNGGASNQNDAELQSLHRTVKQLEERCNLREITVGDAESKLERQEEERIRFEWETKKKREGFEQKIKEKDARMGDMALHIRTRDQQVMALEKKIRRAQRDLQDYHKKKHEIVEQARKLEREAMRDRERAALDIRHMSSSGSYSGAATAATGEQRGDLGRRTPSSGSFFARGTAGGPGAGAATGAAGGGRGAGTPAVPIDQIRKLCVQNNLSEFFMYDPGASRG